MLGDVEALLWALVGGVLGLDEPVPLEALEGCVYLPHVERPHLAGPGLELLSQLKAVLRAFTQKRQQGVTDTHRVAPFVSILRIVLDSSTRVWPPTTESRSRATSAGEPDSERRNVRKLEPHLNPPARTRGSVRPDGRVDVSVSDGAGDDGADCQKWALLVVEQPCPAPGSPERVPGAGDARCSGGRSCAGCARGGLRSRPAGGRGTPI